MKLMFFPVTMIEEFPHVLLYFNFTRKKDRYFLSPYDVEVSSNGSQRTVCEIVRSSDFLSALFEIDRSVTMKETASVSTSDDKTQERTESPSRRALSCSISSKFEENFLSNIEQKLDFKHRCMFYSTGPTSDLCVCALEVDHKSSVLCNAVGYPKTFPFENENLQQNRTKNIFQQRQFVHQWICMRDIIDGLITCNHILKGKAIQEIFSKINLWVKQRYETKSIDAKQIRFDAEINDPKIFKARARQLVWDLMEIKNEVRHPRPSHGRIPNFRYCEVAAENLAAMECFKRARVIKINPSLAQEPVRYFTLIHNKVLLTSTPSLDSALFYKMDPKFLRRNQLEWAATRSGAAELGTLIQLQALKQIHVDLMVVPSVVVNPITGARIDKGKGYADLEYAIMSQLGCVSSKTIVLTTCHESQLINDIPNEVMEEHDLPVDIIVTPKRYIYTKRIFSRPTKINWDSIDPDLFVSIPVLNEFKRLEQQKVIKSQ